MSSKYDSLSVFACLVLLGGIHAGCSTATNTPSNDTGAPSNDAGSKLKACAGEGSWSKGFGLECGGTFEMCDKATTLRVVCEGEKGAASCQCYENGVEGNTFEGKDTCSTAAYKGQREVVEARFKAGCGWEAYDLSW